MQTTASTNGNGRTIYEVGLNELHAISTDEAMHKKVDQDTREARGREGARLHVTLTALNEHDRRTAEALQAMHALLAEVQQRSAQLTHLIQTFEASLEKRITDQHAAVTNQVNSFWAAESEHFNAVRSQVGNFENALSTQTRESTERLAIDVRKLRDEVVSLIDSRMNQSDAAFAAVRGDVEVVKYLVMDLIKDRIGRTDPKQKPF